MVFSFQCFSGGRNHERILIFPCVFAVASQPLIKIKPGGHRQKVWFVLQWSECSSHQVHRYTSECTPVSGCRRCDCNATPIKAVTQSKRHCGTRKFTYGTTIVSDKVRCECSRSQMNKTLPLNPSPNRRVFQTTGVKLPLH